MARKRDGDAILQDVKVQVKSEETLQKTPSSKVHSEEDYNRAKAQLEALRRELKEKNMKEQDHRIQARKTLPGEDLLEVETVPRSFRRKLSVKRVERSKSFSSWLFSNREL